MKIQIALDILRTNNIDFVLLSNIAELEQFKPKFGYYFLISTDGKGNVVKIFDYSNVAKVESIFNTDIQCVRIKSPDVRKHLSVIVNKTYYAVELDTVISFKRKQNTWQIHQFNCMSERLAWLESKAIEGITAKSITVSELCKYKINKKQNYYFAAINPKGLEANPNDKFWKFYRFDNRNDRNKWVDRNNVVFSQAKQVRVSDLYRLANLKYELPLITDGHGQLIINETNQSMSCRHKYYYGFNDDSITMGSDHAGWKVFACGTLKECAVQIDELNNKSGGRIVAKKISREFAYSILKLQSFEETSINEFNEVVVKEAIPLRRIAAS